MRKSVIAILGVAALTASSFATDNVVAKDHNGGRAAGGGTAAFGGSRGAAPSFGHSGRASRGAGASFSQSAGVRSLGGRMSGRVGGSPTFQSNRNISSFGAGRTFSGGGRDFDRDRRHHHRGRDFAFGVVPFGVYDNYYDDNAYDYSDDCYQVRRVRTRYGWRWRRIDVCGYSYY
jgi:hypothetical protein